MDIPSKNRTALKAYFVKNAIPTESNFADLIEAAVNQKDDGLAKPPGNPLCIEASGDAASQKKAINFYDSFGDAQPAWALSLNPRSDPADPATARPGLGISDGDGKLRLFIDRATGEVRLGPAISLGEGAPGEGNVIRWNAAERRLDIGGLEGVRLGYTTAGEPGAFTPVLTVRADGTIEGATPMALKEEDWVEASVPSAALSMFGIAPPVRYLKDALGFVHLQGSLQCRLSSGGATYSIVGFGEFPAPRSHSALLFTLPEGCRPQKDSLLGVHRLCTNHQAVVGSFFSYLSISRAGHVVINANALYNDRLILDGLSFFAG